MHPVHDVDAFEQDVEGQAKVRQVIHTKEKELAMLRESDAIASRDSQLVLRSEDCACLLWRPLTGCLHLLSRHDGVSTRLSVRQVRGRRTT